MKPRKLTRKETKELQKQFPKLEERLQNKLEMIVIIFEISMILLFLYVTYLMVTYQW